MHYAAMYQICIHVRDSIFSSFYFTWRLLCCKTRYKNTYIFNNSKESYIKKINIVSLFFILITLFGERACLISRNIR